MLTTLLKYYNWRREEPQYYKTVDVLQNRLKEYLD